jgi:hypothetical protein
VVRLTSVTISSDPVGAPSPPPGPPEPLAVTEIEWDTEDATPFSFHISGEVRVGDATQQVEDMTVARGNLVLADHGASVVMEVLGKVPEPTLFRPPASIDPCVITDPTPILPRFRPRLRRGPLVHAAPYAPEAPPASARAALTTSPEEALPALQLTEVLGRRRAVPWSVRRDLLQSEPDDRHVVVETETDGAAWLRFGDDRHGQRPAAGVSFTATYRIGEALRGNVAQDTIRHIVTEDAKVINVRNPLPARGGRERETLESQPSATRRSNAPPQVSVGLAAGPPCS